MFLVRYVPEVTTLLWVYAVTVVEAETLFFSLRQWQMEMV